MIGRDFDTQHVILGLRGCDNEMPAFEARRAWLRHTAFSPEVDVE